MDLLRAAAARAPGSLAVAALSSGPGAPEVRWTYGELDRRVDAVARGLVRTLASSGVGPGARAAMRLPASAEAILLAHACRRAGVVVVPMNANWTEAEVGRGLIAVGGASLVVESAADVERLEAAGRSEALPLLVPPRDPASVAALVLTSGSAGSPTPVALSDENFEASARGVIARLELRAEDRWLLVLSPAHVGGYALVHRSALVGSAVVVRARFRAEEVDDLLEAGEVTHASLVPVMLARLLDQRGERVPPATLRCLLIGGARTPRPLLARAFALGYPIALTYGLTEATSQVATATPGEVAERPGTVGRPLLGTEVEIAGATAGGVGEILVRGPTVAGGLEVVGLPPATERAAGVFLDQDGWLHTGDLGRLDEEGYLWVVGRLSDRIVTGGVTVEPAEVEEVMLGCPGVRDAAAFGLPDPEWGERVVVAVVPEDPAFPPSLDAMSSFARARLSPGKRPRELRIVGTLPRNANGKVDRAALREGTSGGS